MWFYPLIPASESSLTFVSYCTTRGRGKNPASGADLWSKGSPPRPEDLKETLSRSQRCRVSAMLQRADGAPGRSRGELHPPPHSNTSSPSLGAWIGREPLRWRVCHRGGVCHRSGSPSVQLYKLRVPVADLSANLPSPEKHLRSWISGTYWKKL